MDLTIDGVRYGITDHARKRFRKRRSLKHQHHLTDEEIVRVCLSDPGAMWADDLSGDGLCLVTLLPVEGRQVRPKRGSDGLTHHIRHRR